MEKQFFLKNRGRENIVFYEKIEGDFIKKREINFIKNTSVIMYTKEFYIRIRIDLFLSRLIFVGA